MGLEALLALQDFERYVPRVEQRQECVAEHRERLYAPGSHRRSPGGVPTEKTRHIGITKYLFAGIALSQHKSDEKDFMNSQMTS